MASSSSCILFIFMLLHTSHAAMFTLRNDCGVAIWPAFQGRPGDALPFNGGLRLNNSQSIDVQFPDEWAGRIWARTGCDFDAAGRNGNCATGDCAGGLLECAGSGGQTPATLAEFSLGLAPLDYYDISLVDGFNVDIWIYLLAATAGNCSDARCAADINRICPEELQVRRGAAAVVGCKSGCGAFNRAALCCTGEYNSPELCKPTAYSAIFKRACPAAYSYAYDDRSSLFNCKGSHYVIRFC